MKINELIIQLHYPNQNTDSGINQIRLNSQTVNYELRRVSTSSMVFGLAFPNMR